MNGDIKASSKPHQLSKKKRVKRKKANVDKIYRQMDRNQREILCKGNSSESRCSKVNKKK